MFAPRASPLRYPLIVWCGRSCRTLLRRGQRVGYTGVGRWDAIAEAIERTWVDDLVEQAEQRGEQRGAARVLQGQLKRQLERRFGAITPEMEMRIRGVEDASRLERLIDRALDAETLDEVFEA